MAKSKAKRQAIITAAIFEFKNRGFDTTSMDQIALTAEVSKRTVYNHFESKDVLFDAIIAQMLLLFTHSVSINYNRKISLSVQLTDVAEQEISLLSDPAFIDLAKVIMAEAMHSPHRINAALAEVEKRDGNLSSWITAANADNVLKVPDVEFAATQFFSLLKAFCFWPQLVQGQTFPDKSKQADIISSAVKMFLSTYQV